MMLILLEQGSAASKVPDEVFFLRLELIDT